MNIFTNPIRGVAAALGLLAMAMAPAAAQDLVTFDAPVVVTSIGQNEKDATALRVAVQRAGVEPNFDMMFAPEAFGDEKTIFLAVGAAEGADMAAEAARAGALIDAAVDKGIKVVLIHLGGAAGRNPQTDQLITAVAPLSDVIIVMADSDADGLIKGLADANDVAYRVSRNPIFLSEDIKAGFGSGS